MHVIQFSHKHVQKACPQMHETRLRALFAGVEGLLRGGRLWLTAVGRHMDSRVAEKHKIKRMDRLLGNHRLGRDRPMVYGWLCQLLIGSCRHPQIIVDWTDVDRARTLFILRAAVAVGGRALPIYEEVHARYHHPEDTGRFLRRLAALLPHGCEPVIVTDAGFRRPWFLAIEALGWYYVGRVRNRDYVRFPADDAWIPGKSLYRQATRTPKALGALWLPRTEPFLTRAYVYHKPPKGRARLTVHGERRRNAASLKHAEREREPWLLISNLPPRRYIAKRVVAIYRDRMTIEQGFRDLKAHRHGFAFRHNLGRQAGRVANLLLIAALAVLCTWLVGLAGTARGLTRALQANTERRRPVLSVFFIGTRLLHQGIRLTAREFAAGLQYIADTVTEHANAYA